MGGIRKRKGIIVRGFIISAVFSPLNSILVLFLFLYPYTTTKASEKNCDFNTCVIIIIGFVFVFSLFLRRVLVAAAAVINCILLMGILQIFTAHLCQTRVFLLCTNYQ